MYLIKDGNGVFFPLIFGSVIGLINFRTHKYNPYTGIILSIIVSFATFFIAYFSIWVVIYILNYLNELLVIDINDAKILTLSFIISPFIIAPLLVYYGYTFIFNFPKTKFTLLVVLIAILLLILQACFYYYYEDFKNNSAINIYLIWQVIMVLALQLIIYQRELKALFKHKNE